MPGIVRIAVGAWLILLAGLPSSAQVFDSGSNGSDGALNLVTPGTVVFGLDTPGLDPDGDHVFHFTTINIGAGVTVRLSTQYLHGPVYWLATGAVTINGIVDLNGENGYNCANTLPDYSLRRPAVGGAGGFNGGVGGWSAGPAALSSQPGSGPNGGANTTSGNSNGTAGTLGANLFLIPMTGGSGGGGGFSNVAGCFAGGGGGGGGAILIASSVSITVTSPGTIRANGGDNGNIPGVCCGGGDGSGGAIRLMAPLIQGNGSISASSPAGAGSAGRIRLESYQQSFAGSVSPIALLSTPSILATVLPSGPPPSIRVPSLNTASGLVALPASPGGTFTVPDATINQDTPVTINIEATSIPVGTVLTLHISSESGPDFTVLTTPLAGTLASSTASAPATFPTGFSRGYIRGTW
jgi:hypothetical protein